MSVDLTGSSPPDGGYGWVIILCFIFINSCLMPLTQCFGIIYESQFHSLNITAAEISFLLHLNNAMMCSLGIISGPLLRKYNFRQVSFFGAILVCLGTFFTTFARSYGSLIFTICFLIGPGQGILLPGMYIAVNSYFKKRLTLAISLQVTGVSLSPIFMPQVCHILLNKYGVQGTVLLLAGISFNAIPAIMLLRPIRTIRKRNDVENTAMSNNVNQHVSERLLSPVYRETTTPAPINDSRSKLKEIIKLFDLELFGNRVYVLIIIGMSISFVAELNIILMMPFVLAELAAFDNQHVATAMSVQAVADIIGRLLIPMIAYKIRVPVKAMYAISLMGSSIGRTVLAYFFFNENVVYLSSIILGLSKGTKAVFQSVIIPKYVSLEKLPAATGLSMVVNGFLSLIIGPIIGLTHDIGDSYIFTLHTATALSLFCVALWMIDYLFCEPKHKTEQNVFTIDTN